ncbi:hypothetical protein GCM10023226_03450 [Nocardioides nanhaiensis]|uniref:Uncharacterized protein n=1 Tax=Nocardioides nanhaiensis TaxID=1476871 RepID=A0ABP8VTH1_9ACTN
MASPDAASNPQANPAPTRSAAPASRDAKPVPVTGSAKTGGDPLKASGKKPDAPLANPPATQDTPAAE